MSRSVKRTPIHGITMASSEKDDKRKANRAFRRRVKQRMSDQDQTLLPVVREISNVWSMEKDGKSYACHASRKAMRK